MRILTKGELHNGAEYLGASRLALSARWDSSLQKFKIMRFKFEYFFIEELPHIEDAGLGEDGFRPFLPMTDVHDRLEGSNG